MPEDAPGNPGARRGAQAGRPPQLRKVREMQANQRPACRWSSSKVLPLGLACPAAGRGRGGRVLPSGRHASPALVLLIGPVDCCCGVPVGPSAGQPGE
jgi:hypothetical protein